MEAASEANKPPGTPGVWQTGPVAGDNRGSPVAFRITASVAQAQMIVDPACGVRHLLRLPSSPCCGQAPAPSPSPDRPRAGLLGDPSARLAVAGEVLVDVTGGDPAGAHRLDHRGRAGHDVAPGPDSLAAGAAFAVGLDVSPAIER